VHGARRWQSCRREIAAIHEIQLSMQVGGEADDVRAAAVDEAAG
jgi:hypothetical protein